MDSAPKAQPVAFHQAGHAVMGCVLGVPFKRVSIEPQRDFVGNLELSTICPDYSCTGQGSFDESKTWDLRARIICVTLAGWGAEYLAMNLIENDDDCGKDEHWAEELASIAQGKPYDGPNAQRATRWVRTLRRNTVKLLSAPDMWLAVEAVAKVLQSRKTLSSQKVHALVAPHVRPGSVRLSGVKAARSYRN